MKTGGSRCFLDGGNEARINAAGLGLLKVPGMLQEVTDTTLFFSNPRMTSACHRKCVPPHYKEAELSKGESVCLDRCVSKYLDIHERMGKKLTELSMQDEELMKRVQQSSGPA